MLKSKIEKRIEDLDLASMLYLEKDSFFEIIKIKGDVVRAHRFLEGTSVVDDKALVVASDAATIVLKRYREKEETAHEILASLEVERAALQVEVIAGESMGLLNLPGINSEAAIEFASQIKYLRDVAKELEIDLKDPLSRILLKDVIRPQVKKGWFLGKKITEKPRNLFCFEFGKSQWGTCFGDIGAEPPLPNNIREILDRPCVFWPDKKVRETHMLVLIPNTINRKPFTLNRLSELIREPKVGYKTQYRAYDNDIKRELGAKSYPSYWVLMTRDVIPNSQKKNYEHMKTLVQTCAQQSEIPYGIPTALEAATAILMNHAKTGERLYSEKVTVCQRPVNKNQWATAIGRFPSKGLALAACCSNKTGSLGSWGVSGICRL